MRHIALKVRFNSVFGSYIEVTRANLDKVPAQSVRRFVHLIRLLARVPRARQIFLRREYDRLGRWLSWLAGCYRRTLLARPRVVAVVGSLGKTTTRRALNAALDCPDRGFSFSNYGASLSANLLRVRWRDAHAVIEAGVAGPGPMAGYARMLRPDIVVVTSIKTEHHRSFPTLFDTRAEKVKMVSALPPGAVAVLNGDDPHVRWMATQTRARVITYGCDPANDVRACAVEHTPVGIAFDAILTTGTHRVQTRFPGEHMLYPCLAAMTVAELEGKPVDGVLGRLAQLVPADSRMELIQLSNGVTVLDDSFKGTIESVWAAMEAFALFPGGRKIVVFGGVEQPPGKQGDINRELGRRLGSFAEVIICLGHRNMSGIRAGAVGAGMKIENIHLAGSRIGPVKTLLDRLLRPGDQVLLKGQSTQRLRRIVLHLQGTPVSCGVKYCAVKVPSCDECPLLNAPLAWFRNVYVARSIRE